MLYDSSEGLPETDYDIDRGQGGHKWGGKGEMSLYYKKWGLNERVNTFQFYL